jgi:tRNA 2-thiouridine synthesizing protein A
MIGFVAERLMPISPVIVDARGHRCPTPTLRLRRALEAAPEGALVELKADDPLARIDVPHFLNATGHRLVEMREEGRALAFIVEKMSRAER